MCGIAGYYDLDGQHPPPLEMLVTWALLSERGKEAAGAMWQERESGIIMYYKSPGASKDLAAHIWPQVTAKPVRWIALHSRTWTKGPPTEAANNHPVRHGNTLVMHNGVITNDDSVFVGLNQKRAAAVDTAAIAACLAIGGIKEVLIRCEGSMALSWTNLDEPSVLHLYTNGRSPLWVSRHKAEYLVYASAPTLIPEPLHGEHAAYAQGGEHIIIDGAVTLESVGRGIVPPPAWQQSVYLCYKQDCLAGTHTHNWQSYDYDLHTAHDPRPQKRRLALPGGYEQWTN